MITAHARREIETAARMMFSLFLSLVLVLGLMPSIAFADGQEASDSDSKAVDSDAAQQIFELLAADDYVEGEVVAAVLGSAADTTDWFADEGIDGIGAEKLADTTAATYVAATEEAVTTASDADETVSIIIIRNDEMTTEEMLYALWDDPRILFVEPDYVSELASDASADEAAVQTIAGLASTTSTESATVQSDSSNVVTASGPVIADATAYQWGLNNDGSTWYDGKSYIGFDINSPGWDDADTQNACGVVAVIDSGVDVDHPDLDGALMTNMESYNSDGGPYGIDINATGEAAKDVTDYEGHGTHVSGIIASEWNGFGTGGVANGVKLVTVKAGTSSGEVSNADLAKSYAYLSKSIDNGLNLVAVNNSWGDRCVSKALSLIVTELGKKGAISVFSSGNVGMNSDYNPTTPSPLKDNPYAIVVDSSSKDGKSDQNFGVSTTDVLAPGKDILSTASSKASGAAAATYLAETDGSALCKCSFDNVAGDSIKAYRSFDEKTLAASDPVGSTSDARYYESGHSLFVDSSNLVAFDKNEYGYQRYGFYIKVPAQSSEKLLFDSKVLQSWSDGSMGVSSLSVAVKNASGETSWTSSKKSDGSPSMRADANETWLDVSLNESYSLSEGQSIAYDENGYMTIRVEEFSATSTQQPDLYLDLCAAGTSAAPYFYASGTSMAAPMVAGAAAVAAKAQGVTSAPTQADAAKLARERVSWLKSHVNQYDGRFLNTCSTGGQIDLSVEASETLPVISSAEVVEGSGPVQVRIAGSSFGSGGTTSDTVAISGKQADIASWSDGQVVVQVPDGLVAGVLSVTVRTAAGSCTEGFLLDIPSASNKAVFEKDIAIPAEISQTSMGNALVGLDGSLYVFPQDQYSAYYQSDNAVSYEHGSFLSLWLYDSADETWVQCADLPEQLDTLSATVHDGKIIVCGTVIDWNTSSARSVLYSFDPPTGTWAALDATHVPPAASIVDAGGKLLLVGGASGIAGNSLTVLSQDNIAELDLASGSVTPVGNLKTPCCSPQVAADGTDIYVAQGWSYSSSMTRLISGMQKLTVDSGTYTATDVSSALPRMGTDVYSVDKKLHGTYGLTELPSGPVISGALVYADGDGASFVNADTYISTDGGKSFADFGKRAYRAPMYYSSSAYSESAATGGWLYTMGSSVYDEDVLVLRATQIVAPTPSPTPEPSPSGNASSSLAKTGDGLSLPALLLISMLLGASLTGVIAVRRKSEEHSRITPSSSDFR